MAKPFTHEQREEVKARIVELVRQSGRETHQQLADKTGVSRVTTGRLSRELAASGEVYNSDYGVFPSEQAHRDWERAHQKIAKGGVKKNRAKKKSDPDLIYSLPDGEIRRYDRRQNIICRECRNSDVMQRVLMFYRDNKGTVKTI
ncbi:DUF977 family protein [Escherichia coli]|uniref:DUF977 family protein n=1 Tax=Escherichia coli TaxID=562 RepID=UPI000707F5F8|nr:DUF977 family protein [Escherichia coli]EEU9537522.1 DUF977 family protein [Escherichia coli]EFO0101115.1 DUF977 family protein [Escherichia coli]EJF6670149.1 DUF977 family protein [Escherichia coli]EJN3597474.1 DUF977 family protein [Escherichia coli]EJN3607214.1 DUF977 family protein [Escherichia coli]